MDIYDPVLGDPILDGDASIEAEILAHYGVKRRSGRYKWGSGEIPYQHEPWFQGTADAMLARGEKPTILDAEKAFLKRVDELRAQGWDPSGENIRNEFNMSSTDYRAFYQLAQHEQRRAEAERAKQLRAEGKSLQEITDIMGYKNDSSIRTLLDEKVGARANQAISTAEVLKEELRSKPYLDVGAGVERELGVSAGKLNEALTMLELEGYEVHGVGIPQVTNPGKQTIMKVLCEPGTTLGDVYKNRDDIQQVKDYHSEDGGFNYFKREYPASIASDRIKIKYGDQGGTSKDGVIEIRPGVEDLNLGQSHYAQVRIMVDGTHYLKGMAMYSDNIPDGYDIVFNTNKSSNKSKMDVLKKIQDDPDNPFGATIKANGQSHYIGKDGKDHLSAINKLKEEGDWQEQAINLSSQFLSKQPMSLIKRQLNLTYADLEDQYQEIMDYTNPTIKRKLLLDFANSCDSAAVHLKAAALPRQKTQVLLPIDELKDNEIYAPNYKNGERVVLIRYPHGGTFEIPELVVNNKNPAAKKALGNAIDAVGINSKVAERLSGADFDGDTATVIPVNDKVKVKTTRPLKELEGFDPKAAYSTEGKTGVKLMKESQKQKQMGIVSNLITDMTLKNAPPEEIAMAVKHSMVVIDAVKHKLDYKQSEKDNHIEELKQKWQVRYDENGELKTGGASTLLSRRKQTVRVPERKGSGRINPETGEVEYKESGRTYYDKKSGKIVPATIEVSQTLYTRDVNDLSSGTPQENAYADYANKVKALGNRARLSYLSTEKLERSPEAAKKYASEVQSLNDKIDKAARNAPKERQAQINANAVVKAKVEANPDLYTEKKAYKKLKQNSINDARADVGASGKGTRFTITDKEWEAIQAGAVSDSKLMQILRYTDQDALKARAMPKTTTQLSDTKVQKIKSMSASGYTNAEIAEALGVSTSTINNYIK